MSYEGDEGSTSSSGSGDLTGGDRVEIHRDERTHAQVLLHHCQALWKEYLLIPLHWRVLGTILALVIIIDGAVLFFVLIGAFGYLDNTTQASILEWSIQIINVCFTLLCMFELPFRIKNSKQWLELTISTKIATGDREELRWSQDINLSSSEDANNITSMETEKSFSVMSRRNELIKPYNKPCGNDYYRWILFGAINMTKIFQISCQFGVEYLCLAYIGRQGQRPGMWFALAVGFALPLGCLIGGIEGYLKS